MIIPKSYMQFARKIEVKKEDNILKDYNGIALPDQNIIVLSSTVERSKLEHTFLHEVLHIAFEMMGEEELYQNESFINILAGLLHQMLNTQKGEL